MISPGGRPPRRVRMPHVERLMDELSARDWAIIDSLHRVRLASGLQLERLHFHDLGVRSRPVMRWRVLKRLVDERVLIPLERRIGTSYGGSAKLWYTLDSAGQRLIRLRANAASVGARVRRPRLAGERFVAHTLAVTELYVALVEHTRLGQFTLGDFQAEPMAWWPNGSGGWMKPDAFVKLRCGTVADYWWIEADLATESVPTVRAKLLTYLDFVGRGQLGPDGVVPRVLIAVPGTPRKMAIQAVVNSLPVPADLMFHVALLLDAPTVVVQELNT
jgi:hypothetical protein